jgi:hypothetical protein
MEHALHHRYPTGKATLISAAAAVAATLAFGQSQALAGACSNTTRDLAAWQELTTSVKAHTTVKNNGSETSYDVVIERGSTEKASKTLAPGDKMSLTSGVSSSGIFHISITPTGASKGTKCAYRVTYLASQGQTQWLVPLKSGVTCSGSVEVTCDKGYNKDKVRWNTTYKATD